MFKEIWNDIVNFFTNNVWDIVLFFAVLVFGVIVAKIILNICRRMLKKTKMEGITQGFLMAFIKIALYLVLSALLVFKLVESSQLSLLLFLPLVLLFKTSLQTLQMALWLFQLTCSKKAIGFLLVVQVVQLQTSISCLQLSQQLTTEELLFQTQCLSTMKLQTTEVMTQEELSSLSQ